MITLSRISSTVVATRHVVAMCGEYTRRREPRSTLSDARKGYYHRKVDDENNKFLSAMAGKLR